MLSRPHVVIGGFHEIGLHTPGCHDDERQQEPAEPVSLAQSFERKIEQRKGDHRKHNSRCAYAVRAFAQEKEGEGDGHDRGERDHRKYQIGRADLHGIEQHHLTAGAEEPDDHPINERTRVAIEMPVGTPRGAGSERGGGTS